MIERLCIVGVGLIGGSIARAAREQDLCREIVGVDSHRENLERALQLGVIDVAVATVAEAAGSADMVIFAAPVGSFEALFAQAAKQWSEDTVYTDVGSTKGSVVRAAEKVFGRVPANFVPAHPIAGAERSGVEAAQSGLYQDKRVILTPLESTSRRALERVTRFWQDLGARVSCMDVSHHDAVLAATSHLPHVLAYALVDMLARNDEEDEILTYAAGGFRDFTRIASSDPQMWLDICEANRAQILPLLQQFMAELEMLADFLKTGESDRLLETFCNANRARQRFLEYYENEPRMRKAGI